MPSLEDLTPEQQEQALRLFSFVKSNPDIEKNIRREAKRKNPNMSAPDIELEDALAKQREEFEAKLKERDAQALTQLQQQRRAEAHTRIREAGLDPEQVEKIMVDESIGNYDTAIKYARAQKQLAPSTPESITPMSLPNSKDLWANKNKFARDSAFEAINELKAGRRLGQ
jgi:hypothetical protein